MSKKPPGLGRNLAAERKARQAATQQARLVPQGLPTVRPDQLMPSPENGRRKLLKIEELAATLSSDGMNTAMTVIPPDTFVEIYPQHQEVVEEQVAKGVLFVVHHGHRRLAAALEAGLDEVPILVRREIPSLRIAAIQENLQRMALNPVEEALEFKEALDETDEAGKQLSQRELAQRVGCSQTYVSQRVALLRLVPALQEAVVNHWLKEQQLLDAGENEDGLEADRLLLPVRDAATVFARLRSDMQEAFVAGELSAQQASTISKLPSAEQAVPSADESADCGAIEVETPPSPAASLPEPRTSTPSRPTSRPVSASPPSTPPSAGPFVSAGTASKGHTPFPEAEVPAVASTTKTALEPRGVIVVRDVQTLADEVKSYLSPAEIEELKALLSV
ncbi:ParB/RepB/Spo0J family partition protein [Streptomyces sp. NPDC088847]|uniref:ParB/RepB/Spo0J family partition protein n=1 Tax=Streptomyces sp. NPDC088847 TaxID=3365909 RepID=UPI0037F3818C